MIQRLHSALLLLLTCAVLYFWATTRDTRIAYVDSAKLLSQYRGMTDAKQAYQSKAVSWQANIDTLTLGVQEAIRRHERALSGMSAQERASSLAALRDKQNQLAQYQRGIQETARREDSKATQLVLSQVNSFLARYGKEHNYNLILVASQAGTIAYAREGLDLTDEVAQQLNAEYIQSTKQ